MPTPICKLSDLIAALQKTQDLEGDLPVVFYEKASDKLLKVSSVVVTNDNQLMLSLEQVDADAFSHEDSIVKICI